MFLKHYILILIITFLFGSAYPVQKLIFNDSVPPLLMGSLRMLFVFLCLTPFWRFEIPHKKYWLPLFCFSITMGFLANLFMTLSINYANIISPIIIGSHLAVPFAILLSSIFLNEKVSIKQWFFIFISFVGVFLIGFDPLLKNEVFALVLVALMAFFYASSQVFSRYLKDLKVVLTNAYVGFVGFIFLFVLSLVFEGNLIHNIKSISFDSWILILHAAIFVSIAAHMSMFYLYRIYPVKKVFPYYALFPVFGVLQTYLIFSEIPTLLTFLGGVTVIISIIFLSIVK